MRRFKHKIVSALVMVSLLAVAGLAAAQSAPPATGAAGGAAPASGATLQEVTVSASAITISGYLQPTPVQSLGIQQLQSAAQPDLTDALRTLPAFGGSTSPQNSFNSDSISTGVAALDQVDLRGLGPNRTLVLIDGQRIVNGSLFGGVETSNIPSTLVERVDVVTGGASAIWGSDAVAGVVNYVLNHNFNGVEINLQGGNNNEGDHEQYRGDITVGTGFADNRGHIEASASYARIPQPFFLYQMEGNAANSRLVENPACQNVASGVATDFGYFCPKGQPWLLPAVGVGLAGATPGGIIDGCLNAAGNPINCSLTNTYFVGPNAQPGYFNPGNVTAGAYINGGTPNDITHYFTVKGVPQMTNTAFAFGSFKFNDHLEVTAQLNWGYTSFYQDSYFGNQLGSVNIETGNPFIPASIQSQMTAQGVSTLQMGTINTNPLTGPIQNLQSLVNTVGGTALFESRRLMRGVLGFDGDIGANWSWHAYYERSETRQIEDGLNNFLVSALNNAENAVTVGNYTPTYTAGAYPNPLGIPTGQITCASNLLPVGAPGRTTNCAPLNIFGSGPGVASPAAIAYVQSVTHAGGDENHTDLTENVGAATVQGKLPFGAPAGPIALAAGLVYRSEAGIKVNCGYNCSNVLFPLGNFASFLGNYDVKEGSVEFNAPLLKDQVVKDLSIDAAYRGIDYSTSGFVQTYKLGVVSQLTDWVRFRGSYSRDIRAGDLSELFGEPATDGTSSIDPRTGLNVKDFTIHEGNRNVQPEFAETRTAGLVFTPIQGLNASIDWYYIKIKNVINEGLGTTAVINFCKAGLAAYCEDIIYGTYPSGSCTGPAVNSCPLNLPLFGVISQAVNSDSQDTSGLDFLADYRMPFLSGALDFNTVDNYVFMERYTTLGNTCDQLNSLAPDQYDYSGCNTTGNPKFRGTTSVTYAQAGWLGTVQFRMIGAAHLASNWTSGLQVPDNDIPFYTYVDLRLSYAFANGVTLYGAIDNLGDREVPATPASPFSGWTLFDPDTRDDIYDGFGRVWRLGLRAKF